MRFNSHVLGTHKEAADVPVPKSFQTSTPPEPGGVPLPSIPTIDKNDDDPLPLQLLTNGNYMTLSILSLLKPFQYLKMLDHLNVASLLDIV